MINKIYIPRNIVTKELMSPNAGPYNKVKRVYFTFGQAKTALHHHLRWQKLLNNKKDWEIVEFDLVENRSIMVDPFGGFEFEQAKNEIKTPKKS